MLPDADLTTEEALNHFYKGVVLGFGCEETKDRSNPERCLNTLPFFLGQVAGVAAMEISPVSFTGGLEVARELANEFQRVARNVLDGNFDDLTRRWFLDQMALFFLLAPFSPLIKVCPHTHWPTRRECAKAFTHGFIDGFAAGLEGEWEAIKETPGFLLDTLKATAITAGVFLHAKELLLTFATLMAVSPTFRKLVLEKLSEFIDVQMELARELPGLVEELVAAATEQLIQHVEQVSRLNRQDPHFKMWLLMYPTGWIFGLVLEAIVVTAATAAAGKAILAIPRVQKLLATLRFLVQTAFKISSRVVGKALRKWGFGSIEFLQQVAKDERSLINLDKWLSLGMDRGHLEKILRTGRTPEDGSPHSRRSNDHCPGPRERLGPPAHRNPCQARTPRC